MASKRDLRVWLDKPAGREFFLCVTVSTLHQKDSAQRAAEEANHIFFFLWMTKNKKDGGARGDGSRQVND